MILIYKNKCDTIWILIFIKITYFIMIINKKKNIYLHFQQNHRKLNKHI